MVQCSQWKTGVYRPQSVENKSREENHGGVSASLFRQASMTVGVERLSWVESCKFRLDILRFNVCIEYLYKIITVHEGL